MKRSAQRAASRDRKRRSQKKESKQSVTPNYVAPMPSTTIDDCLAEMESSILPTAQTIADETVITANDTSNNANELGLSTVPGLFSSTAPQPKCSLNATILREKVEIWNQTIRLWSKSDTTPPQATLVPSFEVEMTRHFKLQELSTFFLEASLVTDAAGHKSAGLKMPSFERWLIDAKLEDANTTDPILPKDAHIDMQASKRLVDELSEIKPRTDAQKLVKQLCRRSNQCHAFIQKQPRRPYAWKKGDQIDIERNDDRLVTLVYRRPKQWKKPFCIKVNRSHYDKLKELFEQRHGMTPRVERVFHVILMVLLLRYSSLSGGHLLQELRGGGMQGAIHEGVFDVLTNEQDAMVIEGFGSPFNCFLKVFGSAFFHDLDWHFGSVGNFLELPLAQEALHHDRLIVQANPPFAPGVMEAMSEHILQQLELANGTNAPLTFVVIVPSPGDLRDPDRAVAKRHGGHAVQRLLDPDVVESHHIVLAAKEHGYIEGAQHLRPTRYKESLYDTSIIIVSSKAAAEKLQIESLEEKLREAFRSKHRDETNARRLSTNDGEHTSDSGE